MMPTITSERKWNSDAVRTACIRNDLYTCGDCVEYSAMLNKVDEMEPTPENLYIIAADITDHSDLQTVTNVMFILEREAINTFYFIDGSDEI